MRLWSLIILVIAGAAVIAAAVWDLILFIIAFLVECTMTIIAIAGVILNVVVQVIEWIILAIWSLLVIVNNVIRDRKNRVEVRYLPITHVNKKEMVGFAKELYTQGKGSLAFWAASCGISPDVFESMLDYELENDWENRWPVHRTSYTQPGDNAGGRPTTDTPTENTIRSRDNNGNALPSPSDH